MFVKQLYEKYLNINITILPEKYENNKLYYNVPINHLTKYLQTVKDYDLIKTGNSFSEDRSIIPEWSKMNHIGEFWRKFYYQANLPYSIRNKYLDINRNHKRELDFYNEIKTIYGEKYIFVHDHCHIIYNHRGRHSNLNRDRIINDDIPIFHPNINFYCNNKNHKFYKLWNKDLIKDNLLDYCMILEKSYIIHCIESSFTCLSAYLNLDKVKNKYIYETRNLDLIDYHPFGNFHKWKRVN